MAHSHPSHWLSFSGCSMKFYHFKAYSFTEINIPVETCHLSE